MAAEATKHLERAKKYLERNKLESAIEEYEAALEEVPNSYEVIQALADLHLRLNQPERAARYYGMVFDRYAESGDPTKAVALYTRFLRDVSQPPDRIARFALLLQKQGKREEAIEQYGAAAERFLAEHKEESALACWEKSAQLDPDNPNRHLKIGEVGESIGKADVAARGFLRAGQLALAAGSLDRAQELLARAHRLAPGERSIALFYAQALLRKEDAARAAELLEPFAVAGADPALLEVLGEALLHTGKTDRAREVFEEYHKAKPDTLSRLFDVADQYLKGGIEDIKGVDLLAELKKRLFAAKQQNEFTAQVDALAAANPQSMPLAEFCVKVYDELNRESKCFDALVRYFDLSVAAGQVAQACEALNRLVDIDPYDHRHQERVSLLEGKADPGYLRGLTGRMAKAVTTPGRTIFSEAAEPAAPAGADAQANQALEDLLVQVEICLQYSLRDKALERLKKVAEMFPGEEQSNERLRAAYQQAGWWPEGAPPAAPSAVASAPSPSKTGVYSADMVRDLARISEITRMMYRQATAKAVLSTAVNEIGKSLRATRCLAAWGSPGQPPQMAAEFCASGVEAAGAGRLVQLLSSFNKGVPDPSGALQVQAATAPVLREMGLEGALAVPLTDKETQAQVGMLVIASAPARAWKAGEGYLLQAIGDQVVLAVNQAKLRSLARTIAVADEKTGLLSRSSYQDCLLAETNRAKKQGTPVSLVLLQMDRGSEILRQHGEAKLERFMEQLARTLQSSVRQNDIAVKYTAWALAFVLPDTALVNAKALAAKLRKVSAGVRPPWDQMKVELSAAVAEAVNKPEYDTEDIVTDLINRAEFSLEEARKKGGDAVVSL